MRPPEKVKRDLVQQWLAKADEDLNAAKALLSLRTAFFSTIGFHCQQAAEKYFKAFLTWEQIEFPKTHDLSLLLGLIATAAPSLAESLEEVAELTSYGVEICYPGDIPEITSEDAAEAMQWAEKVKEATLSTLKGQIWVLGKTRIARRGIRSRAIRSFDAAIDALRVCALWADKLPKHALTSDRPLGWPVSLIS